MAENNVEKNSEQQSIPESQEQRKDVVTVVLTADNHLGYAAFGQHPRKREALQQRLRHAFQQAADFAIGQGVDLFIQAGDLFDTTTPDEKDRSFVAARLAQLKQAGVTTVALGGVHDTPAHAQTLLGEVAPAPQISYARLGALHYLPPIPEQELEPVIVKLHGVTVGIYGLGVLAGQEGDPVEGMQVPTEVEHADIPLLVLHAPIEGLINGSSLLDARATVKRTTLEKVSALRYILAGYHHSYSRNHIGQAEVVVAGATQHVDFSTPDHAPGFVFLGLAADGIRWCNHISVEALELRRLTIQAQDLWPDASASENSSPTSLILDRLRPLCDTASMVQLRLAGELTRRQYHQLDLNQIRRYGEEQCFALAIDDSALALLPEQEAVSAETGERFSPREELVSLAEEWIAAAGDELEKKALRATKEELLLAMDDMKKW